MEVIDQSMRLDRATLRRARRRDDGTMVYDAILVSVGDLLEYGDRTETPTREALSDPEYLEGLRGLRLLQSHSRGLIGRHVAPDDPSVRHVGTVLDARFDEESGAVVLEIAVHDASAIEAIARGMRDLSEGYHVPQEAARPREDGVIEQTKRIPNHVALLDNGRAPSTVVRLDTREAHGGTRMDTPETDKIDAARYDAMVGERDAAVAQLDEMRGQYDGMKARMDSLSNALRDVLEIEIESDDEESRMDAAGLRDGVATVIGERVSQVVALRAQAAKHGIEIADTDVDPASIRRTIAQGLGADEARLDSAGYAQAWIDAFEARPVSSLDSFRRGFTPAGTHLDGGDADRKHGI